MINTINFPGLGIYLNIKRVAFTVGIREIYWYGIIIGIGLLLAVIVANALAKREGLPVESITDIALISTPVSIIFARLYFVFWNWKDYSGNFADIINIRKGGLAIYGAIIGGVLMSYIYCRVKKTDVKKVFDVGSYGLLTGQIIGRWGNFVNAEAYGSETSLPWRMELYSSELGRFISVHPTFLYESLWNLAGLVGLLIYRKRKKFDGELFLIYVAWYGIGRSWIEQLRVDSLPYEANFKVSQIFAIITAVLAIALIIYKRLLCGGQKEKS
jgi:phosphatidylglycerol:prolipoprotein diacylglycerol transferase